MKHCNSVEALRCFVKLTAPLLIGAATLAASPPAYAQANDGCASQANEATQTVIVRRHGPRAMPRVRFVERVAGDARCAQVQPLARTDQRKAG